MIPAFAVPVSLIGMFVVLLTIGYSANTVSLLAILSKLARREVDKPVFDGMIRASFNSILVILPLYVTWQPVRERLRPAVPPQADQNVENAS